MKKALLLVFSIGSVLIACNNNADKQAEKAEPAGDSVVVEQQEDSLPSEDLAIINATGFSQYARSSMPQLNWSKFTVTKFWQEDFQHKTAFVPEKNYYETYGQFLKYAPDSSKFIDLDSYNVSIRKDKKGNLIGEAQGPETEVSLIDLKTKEKMQLVFLGPNNSIEDAAWIDNNNLILIGYIEDDTGSGTNPAIWQFNLVTKRVNLYEMSDNEVLKSLRNYSEKVRLKNVIMK